MAYRVLHLLGSAQPEGSGIFHFVSGLARGLDPKRFRVEAWFLGEDGPLAKQMADSGAGVRVIPWRGVQDLAGGLKFWSALRVEQFDLIHQSLWGRRVSWMARRASRARLILHLHSNVPESRGVDPARIVTAGADAVIAASHHIAQWAAGGPIPKVIHPGVRVPESSERNPGRRRELTIGTAGRLVAMKGVEFLIRAMALLRAEFPDLRLEIAGTGPEHRALQEETRRQGLEECVAFLGWRDDLAELLSSWEVYIQSSVMEPFGLATVEAMAAGLPVVATEVGGLPEIVENGRTGWLVPARDAQALAARIRELLQDPEQRRAMGEAGRESARNHFSVESMTTQIVEVYEEVLRAANMG